jgi:hypothetical protein
MRVRALVTLVVTLALTGALTAPAHADPAQLTVYGTVDDVITGSSTVGVVIDLIRVNADGSLGEVLASTTKTADRFYSITVPVSSGLAVVRFSDPLGRFPTTYASNQTTPGPGWIDLGSTLGGFDSGQLTPAGRYVPVAPVRIADTRDRATGPMAAGEYWQLPFEQLVGADVTAVVLNVTTTRTACPTSYLSAGPYLNPTFGPYLPGAKPGTSILNARGGVDVANLVTVRVDTGRTVTLYNDQCPTDVVVDLEGFYTAGNGQWGNDPGAGFEPITPTRVVDTREGRGGAAWGAGERRRVDLASAIGVPAGAVAVAVNLTSTGETAAASYLSAFATGDPNGPSSSVLNARRGQDVANLAIVPLAADGSIEVYNNAGTTDLVADVMGWYTADGGADFYGLDAQRTASPPHLGAGETRLVTDLGHQIAVPDGAVALALNLTSTRGTAATSYLTAYPAAVPRPLSSNVNTVAGVDLANSALVPLDGGFRLYNNAGDVDVYEDVYGYFAVPPTT